MLYLYVNESAVAVTQTLILTGVSKVRKLRYLKSLLLNYINSSCPHFEIAVELHLGTPQFMCATGQWQLYSSCRVLLLKDNNNYK